MNNRRIELELMERLIEAKDVLDRIGIKGRLTTYISDNTISYFTDDGKLDGFIQFTEVKEDKND